ncbi:hypothetical protein [Flavobacterium pedocola]
MKAIHPYELLNQKITEVKHRQEQEYIDLRSEVQLTLGSLTPEKLIHRGIDEIFNAANSKKILWAAAAGIIGNYLSKKIIGRKTENSLLPMLGNLAQFALTSYLAYQSKKEE